MGFYDTDLAFVHDAAFGDYARRIAAEIARLLARSRIDRGRIVELGCGSGITAAYLTARGYRVLGIDASRAMIRLARERAPHARFRVGRIGSVRLPSCVAALALGEVVTYAIEPGHGASRPARLFSRVRRAGFEVRFRRSLGRVRLMRGNVLAVGRAS